MEGKTVSYKITKEMFTEYNMALVEDIVKEKGKRLNIMGIVEIVISVIFFVSILVTKTTPHIGYIILGALLLVTGIYSMFYFRIIFKRRLLKDIDKVFEKGIFDEEVSITFTKDGIRQVSGEDVSETPYADIWNIKETALLIVLMFAPHTGYIIPRELVDTAWISETVEVARAAEEEEQDFEEEIEEILESEDEEKGEE